jgi:hypothetical protein
VNIRPLPAYFGKCPDATGATIASLAIAAGLHCVRFSDCATGRPFVIVTHADYPRLWLRPWVKPLTGLLNGLRHIGAEPEVLPFPVVAADQPRFWTTAISWLEYGPVAVGPLARRQLWDRLEDHFYQGNDYFVVLICDAPQDGSVFIHDPEGLPMGLLQYDDLARAASPDLGTVAIRVASTTSPTRPAVILERGLALRRRSATSPDVGSAAIRMIVNHVSRGLRACEKAALWLGIAARGRSLASLTELLALADQGERLDAYRRGCCDVLDALRWGDDSSLARNLAVLALHEDQLDDIMERTLLLMPTGSIA